MKISRVKYFTVYIPPYALYIFIELQKKLMKKVSKHNGVLRVTWIHPTFYKLENLITFIELHIPPPLRAFTKLLRLLNLKLAKWHKEKYFKMCFTIFIYFRH